MRRPGRRLRKAARLLPLAVAFALSGCMAREVLPPTEPLAAPVPAGISPLTVEQDEALREQP